MPEEPNDKEVNEETGPQLAPGNNVRSTWQFSLHDVRINMSHCAAEAKAVMIEAFLWCIDPQHPITRQEFAKAIGYDPTTVWKVYAGKYNAPDGTRLDVPSKMLKAAHQFLELEKERVHGGKTEFVMTPTARKIFTHCDLARESQTPGFVIGPSHIGKTWAFEAYTPMNNHGRTVHVRMKAACGLGGMVRRISGKVGNSEKGNTAALIDRIKRALTPNTLVILDEVHLLQYTYRIQSFFACMEVIREIYDEVGCGMVLCGTKLFIDRIEEGKHGEMEQILRRGVHRLVLPNMPTVTDLTAIFEHNGLEFPEPNAEVIIQFRASDGKTGTVREQPRAVIRQLAKLNGLKAITERLRYGRKLAAKARTKLTWHHFVDAHLRIERQATADADWD
jgi:DNA transposition AAA+ family ATPase